MPAATVHLVGGFGLVIASLVIMLATGAPIPVPVTFLVVGFALIRQSRRID